jgi:hypothetical protein
MPEGGMFPDLYDGGGGDQVADAGDDISGQPLPSLSNENRSFADQGGTMSSIPGVGSYAQQPDQPEPQQPQPQQPAQRPRSVSQRISQLVGQRNQRDEQISALNAELSALRDQVFQAQQAVQAPVAMPNPSPPTSVEDLLSPQPARQQPQIQPGQLTADSIRQLIREEVQPIAETLSDQSEERQRFQRHNESFGRAAAEFIELQNPDSEARQVFNETFEQFRGTPVFEMDNAPEIVAAIVRGYAREEQVAQAAQQPRKIAAQVHTPQPAPIDHAGLTQKAKAGKVADEALQRIKYGDKSFEAYKAARMGANQAGRTETNF